ncbi:double-strand break repair protein AddB [Defluviimonas aestuarii]|uniref:double-strand break repair protein AddB n=1 Tax=Albidovulum aestuarii TaxID=1130726 RepID=UPI00249B1DEB|nr:double-strand break repair protein AddB [Defluviimonas aestuarii]MDI3337842.1 double-strand break repair protein AddB [Defluviimonas aestuarii]
MFEALQKPRVFALPPGADVPGALVSGLMDRLAGYPPETLPRVTLYLNTSRMLRSVRQAFDAHGACLLPRLRLITDLGQDPLAGLPPSVPPLRRRLELAQLVGGLVAQQGDFAPGTAIYDLADSLARLMDEMQSEGVAPKALEASDLAENHAAHWERSLAFIRIVARYFEADAAPDSSARQRKVIEALVKHWHDAPPADPVIVAGSTGSRGATQIFLQAVARLPQGAVVLPGFDFGMPEFAWNSLCSGQFPAEDHPQYRFWPLMQSLQLKPADIPAWQENKAPDPSRNRLLSLALRPAPVTDQWMTEGATLGLLSPATDHLTLIEAPSERAEATAIALCLRKAAEDGRRAALITPDRNLTRRVSAALDRWGIRPDDSAGQPLVQTAPGRLLRHTAALLGRKLTSEALLILLKHPLAATGAGDRGNHLRFTRDLELKLRRKGPPFPTGEDLTAWARTGGDAERAVWAQWVAAVIAGVEAVQEDTVSTLLEMHLATTCTLAAGPGGDVNDSEMWRQEAGELCLRTMEDLRREADHGGKLRPVDYANLVSTLLANGSVRRSEAAHPLIAIWGTLEARVQGADLVILSGLNDGVWPATPAPDPWLSRQMRFKTGLLLPERQIGLSAHDFQQAAAAPEVIFTRAIRDSEAETVPSRWLARLTNLLEGLPDQQGPTALRLMRDRGKSWLDLAAAAELVDRTAPAQRPAPRPPVAARPRELPVTGIERLIRDPYAIYARSILRLRPLEPLRPTPDARLRGKVLHKLVETFIKTRPQGESENSAHKRLLELAESVLDAEIAWPSARRLWLARLTRIADSFVATENSRQAVGDPFIIEKTGSVTLENGLFTVTARPDRIDLLNDGRVHIYDYKTGIPPSDKKQKAFEKQLILEAAMAERGGFAELGPREVAGTTYIHLGGEGGERPGLMEEGLMEAEWDRLGKLIAAYLKRETGFISRRAVFESRRPGDYDHLARFGEWQMSDAPVPENVG